PGLPVSRVPVRELARARVTAEPPPGGGFTFLRRRRALAFGLGLGLGLGARGLAAALGLGAQRIDELLELLGIEAVLAARLQLFLERLDLSFGDGGRRLGRGGGIQRAEQVPNALFEEARSAERAARLALVLGLLEPFERLLERFNGRVALALRQANARLVKQAECCGATPLGVLELAVGSE